MFSTFCRAYRISVKKLFYLNIESFSICQNNALQILSFEKLYGSRFLTKLPYSNKKSLNEINEITNESNEENLNLTHRFIRDKIRSSKFIFHIQFIKL